MNRGRTFFTALLLVQAMLVCLSASSAGASLDVFYSDVGHLTLSTDGIGTTDASGTVQAEKPTGGTVKRAFLFAASTGFSDYTPPDDDVTIDGVGVKWDSAHTVASDIGSVNVASDVTDLVKPKIDAAPAGRVDFTIGENNTGSMDGEILAVIFDDPSVRTNTVYLMYGAQRTSGDHFAIGLGSPLQNSSTANMGLGISFGFQPAGQYSQVDVDGSRLTTSAGGQDDGAGQNGALLTVGGLDDNPSNPTDPLATDGCGIDPRCDDELYDLKPFLAAGDTSIGVDTLNPSTDDNIYFASLTLNSATALVGEGVALSPAGTRSQVGTFHFFKAFVQDSKGNPEEGRDVTLRVVSGPNAGMTRTATTGSDGKASFNYASFATGTDTLEASFVDSGGTTHTSSPITQTWAPHVDATFGGSWPYSGGTEQLYYTYGGGHRYLGNVVQGAANWNNAGTKAHISEWPGAPYAIQIPFADVTVLDTWTGMTLFADDCSTCGYTRTAIELNRFTLDGASDAQRTKVATHELGHALGLQHPYGWVTPSTPSVMWQGDLGGSVKQTPQPYDVSRVNGMYP